MKIYKEDTPNTIFTIEKIANKDSFVVVIETKGNEFGRIISGFATRKEALLFLGKILEAILKQEAKKIKQR